MGWYAHLLDRHDSVVDTWWYTHNTNCMANVAMLERDLGDPELAWWEDLNGLSGPDGARLLDQVIGELEYDPVRYRVMNADRPGTYAEFLAVLKAMRDGVPEWPTTWETGG